VGSSVRGNCSPYRLVTTNKLSPTSSGRILSLTRLWRLLEIFAKSPCRIWASSPVGWFPCEEMAALNIPAYCRPFSCATSIFKQPTGDARERTAIHHLAALNTR
jgi:hypothetical protein